MKKGTFYFLLGVLISSILITPSFAHPGRTDANGGHRVSDTGEYHYHHGYPAHQHTGGSCPYDFDDKTGQSSGSNSNSGSSGNSNSSTQSTAPSSKTKESKTSIFPIVAIGLLSVFSALDSNYSARRQKERRRSEEERRRKLEEERRRKFEENRAKYISLYGGKTRNELARLAGMPNKTIIGEDNLPKEFFGSEQEKWGYNYTFYVSQSGKSFHGTRSCHHAAHIEKNAVNLGDRAPCSLCKPYKPDLKWYWEYKKILNIVEKYNIDIPEE